MPAVRADDVHYRHGLVRATRRATEERSETSCATRAGGGAKRAAGSGRWGEHLVFARARERSFPRDTA